MREPKTAALEVGWPNALMTPELPNERYPGEVGSSS